MCVWGVGESTCSGNLLKNKQAEPEKMMETYRFSAYTQQFLADVALHKAVDSYFRSTEVERSSRAFGGHLTPTPAPTPRFVNNTAWKPRRLGPAH